MRRAAGGVVGQTAAAQVRQAARHRGYAADDRRFAEAWHGRFGSWSAAAVDEQRTRFTAWREREAAVGAAGASALARRVGEVRRLLAEAEREVASLEAAVAIGGRGDRGSAFDV